uniref:Zinc finger protein 598 n=1 Tax=Labrus bergylta TaxID=56723 RepID=A0A3Q3G9M5_9LABR
MDSTSTKETEKHCVLCCQEVDIFALGKCDHPVCYRCSTKMRVLCDQKYCAVCREELDKVVFVKKVDAFSSLPYQLFTCEKKHDIYFGDERIYAQYRHLLLPECVRCSEPKVFSKFEELEQHMRKQHELFCCKLCSKHLKIFSHERKWYNRKELARHRAHGDPDDTSHRGHPLCKFCDDRYLDNDELLKHLHGSQEYYSDYPYLSDHFRESHYLCEEGRCATEQFTHAFRSEIDYKAHKAAAHSKNRAEARQNRHIDLQFNYTPRQQRRNDGNEEEDRELAAARRASMAMRRQEERAPQQPHPCNSFTHSYKLKSSYKPSCAEIFTLSCVCVFSVKPAPAVVTAVQTALKEDDFPSLSAVAVSSPMTPAYSAQPRKTSSFHEEDFPALVSKIRPLKTLLSSSTSSSSRKKKKVGENGKAASTRSPPSSDDDGRGLTQKEFRSVPTMLDISSLLTNTAAPSTSVSSASGTTQTPSSISVETAAQKENVPEKTWIKPSGTVTAPLTSGLTNGHPEKSTRISKEAVAVKSNPNTDPPLEQEEEFPALIANKPPPGTSSAPAPSSAVPPPPPGLGVSATKPPPGFTGIPLNSNVVEPAPSAVNIPPKISSSGYLVPEDFHQRNLELIQSIRKYLHNDESKFNEFKNFSAQFRQGVISAAQYHCSCRELLGDDFNRIFNELLVLLPDTSKQQELLTAHGDCKALEKQSGPTTADNAAAELDCQVCPTCRQVLAPKDFNSHKTLHNRDNEEFPSLQSISRIIS